MTLPCDLRLKIDSRGTKTAFFIYILHVQNKGLLLNIYKMSYNRAARQEFADD